MSDTISFDGCQYDSPDLGSFWPKDQIELPVGSTVWVNSPLISASPLCNTGGQMAVILVSGPILDSDLNESRSAVE